MMPNFFPITVAYILKWKMDQSVDNKTNIEQKGNSISNLSHTRTHTDYAQHKLRLIIPYLFWLS